MFSFASQMRHAAKRIYRCSPGRSGVRRPGPDETATGRGYWVRLRQSVHTVGRSLYESGTI